MTKPVRVTVELIPREMMMIRLIAEDKEGKEIANILHLSESMTRKLLTVLYQKIGVSSRLSLALWAVKQGIVKL